MRTPTIEDIRAYAKQYRAAQHALDSFRRRRGRDPGSPDYWEEREEEVELTLRRNWRAVDLARRTELWLRRTGGTRPETVTRVGGKVFRGFPDDTAEPA